MSQVCHLYIHPHLCLITLVKDIKHLLCVICDLDGVKVYLFLCKLLYLLFYNATLWVTFGVIIAASIVILSAMARGVCNENRILALCLPFLLESVLKPSCHILW